MTYARVGFPIPAMCVFCGGRGPRFDYVGINFAPVCPHCAVEFKHIINLDNIETTLEKA